MKKSLLLIALLLVCLLDNIHAQVLFTGPDTVCVRQPVQLTTSVTGATSYYWSFCSGYLVNPPVGNNLGANFSLSTPGGIDIAKDPKTGNYYGFTVNTATTEFLRLNFGQSLSNTPSVTDFGNFNNVLSTNPTSLCIVRDSASGNWFVFITAGHDMASSSVSRVDFGTDPNNATPNIATFGNLNNILNVPVGIFVAQEGTQWYGYLLNNATSRLVRLEFGGNVSNTPVAFDDGNLNGILGGPSDMAAVKDGDGNWELFVTNLFNNSVARIDIGSTLANPAPTGANLGNLNGAVAGPTAISLVSDCGSYYAYITDGTTNSIARMEMGSLQGPYTGTDYGNTGNLNAPAGLSSIIRDHDNLYSFVTNSDNSLTQIAFPACTNTTIPSATSMTPPMYSYDTPGVYNIYFAVDEGLPTMQVMCKTIDVLPIPALTLSADTTLCIGDTLTLAVASITASSYLWSPDYNITDTTTPATRVYPYFTTTYNVQITYPSGCIVDTPVHVTVSRVVSDAGPDRVIADGATTILGGPLTSSNSMGSYTYSWAPPQFISNTDMMNPTATPPYDFTYYLTTTEHNDTFNCAVTDTVVVHVDCEGLNLPNGFVPGSTNPGSNTFGILNNEIVKLNYLRIYNRWGQEVFETSDPTQKWDGSFNGNPAPMGVYVWEADGFCLSGHHFTKSGNVTLIR